MQTKGDIAKQYFLDGYNCAQAVLLAFADDFGLEKNTAVMLSSSFGGGMGRLREVCGAVSAMLMLIGLKEGYTSPNDDKIKEEHYAKVQSLAKEFEAKFGTIICRELLNLTEKNSTPTPSKRDEKYYQERPCAKFVEFASELIEKELDT